MCTLDYPDELWWLNPACICADLLRSSLFGKVKGGGQNTIEYFLSWTWACSIHLLKNARGLWYKTKLFFRPAIV